MQQLLKLTVCSKVDIFSLKMRYFLIILSSFLTTVFAHAADVAATKQKKIMAVEFEFRDVSPIPNVAQEVERTALIDSVIKKTLAENGYEIMPACGCA